MEKEASILKNDLKISLPVYKVVYSAAFVLILSLVRGITSVGEIGVAMESPIALLSLIFCADTYLIELQSKRGDIFRLYPLKKQTTAILRRLAIQMIYLLILAVVGYGFFYWQRPDEILGNLTSPEAFALFMTAIPGTIMFWGMLSMTISNFFRNLWAGIGLTFVIWISLISKAGSEFLDKWNVFSYTFMDIKTVSDFSWMCGKILSVVLALLMMGLIPVLLKKRR